MLAIILFKTNLLNKLHKPEYLIAFLGTLWAMLIIFLNVQLSSDASIQHGMITTADDFSYKAPAENFLETGVWKDNFEGASSYMQRTPGMGIWHLAAISILPQNPEIIHLIFHFLLHFLALLVLYKILQLHFSASYSSLITILYALLPCFWGYLNYFLTESVTPSLLILLYGSYLQFEQTKNIKWIFIQSVLVFVLSMIRMQLLIFSIPFILQILKLNYTSSFKLKPVLILIFAFSGITLWQIRNTVILKEWPGLHPIYHETNQSLYRPVHQSLGELYKIWEENGAKFHRDIEIISNTGFDPETERMKKITAVINSFPSEITAIAGKKTLVHLFIEYSIICKEIKEGHSFHSERENNLLLKINKLTAEIKSEYPLTKRIFTLFRSAVFLFSKSQLNQPVFQNELRGFWWMEGIRILCIILINLSFLFVLLSFFMERKFIPNVFNFLIFAYIFYLIFFQTMNEERYLLPVLPLMFINMVVWVGKYYFKNKVRKREE